MPKDLRVFVVTVRVICVCVDALHIFFVVIYLAWRRKWCLHLHLCFPWFTYKELLKRDTDAPTTIMGINRVRGRVHQSLFFPAGNDRRSSESAQLVALEGVL